MTFPIHGNIKNVPNIIVSSPQNEIDIRHRSLQYHVIGKSWMAPNFLSFWGVCGKITECIQEWEPIALVMNELVVVSATFKNQGLMYFFAAHFNISPTSKVKLGIWQASEGVLWSLSFQREKRKHSSIFTGKA